MLQKIIEIFNPFVYNALVSLHLIRTKRGIYMKKFLCVLFSAAVLLATCGCSAGTSSSEPADEVAPEQLTAKYAALAGKAISAGIGKTVAVLSNGTAIGAGDLVYSLSDWSHVAAVSCAGRKRNWLTFICLPRW